MEVPKQLQHSELPVRKATTEFLDAYFLLKLTVKATLKGKEVFVNENIFHKIKVIHNNSFYQILCIPDTTLFHT